jgi:integrase/recombinase XerD
MTPAKGQPSSRKGQEYAPQVLTSDEVSRLLDATSNYGKRNNWRRAPTGIRSRALITLLYRSGLRISEVLALRPSDIDFAAHSIRLLHTKSGHAQTRAFHPSADDALMRWLDTRRDLGINGHHTVFCTLEGRPLSDRYVRQMLHRTAEAAGIEKRVHPHGFRHTFAAELEASGMTLSEISRLLGHAGVATTEKYLRSLTNHQAVAALAGVTLPSIGDERAKTAGTALPREDLMAIQAMLNDPDARKVLADIARTAAARKRK